MTSYVTYRHKKSSLLDEFNQISYVKFRIEAGQASSAAPLGPILGQYQIPLTDFCDSFNFDSNIYYPEYELRVLTIVHADEFNYIIRFPNISAFLQSNIIQYGFDLDNFIYPFLNITIEDFWFSVKLFSEIYVCSYFRSAQIMFGFLGCYNLSIILLNCCCNV